jgi:Uma2 family endonuclease
MDSRIANDTILEPDRLIVCRETNAKILDFAPVLVVKILSPLTALRDRNTKYQLYQREGVKYYLIVDAEKETVKRIGFLQRVTSNKKITICN